MPNPFTDESRDARLKLGVDGFCDTLRSPESIKWLVMQGKPAGFAVGDFALLSMVDAIIDRHKVAHDYRAIQCTLDTLFGPVGTNGTPGADRHQDRKSA